MAPAIDNGTAAARDATSLKLAYMGVYLVPGIHDRGRYRKSVPNAHRHILPLDFNDGQAI